MNILSPARPARLWRPHVLLPLFVLLGTSSSMREAPRAWAQGAAAASTQALGGGLFLQGEARVSIVENGRSGRIVAVPGSVVRIYSSQLDISAPLITFERSESSLQVRAQNGISFKYNGSRPRAGGPSSTVRVETTARSATFSSARNAPSRLLLEGDVDGFYELDGGRTTLGGQNATIVIGREAGDVNADIEGGAAGVLITLPEQTMGEGVSLGTVNIHAARATISGRDGTAALVGNARLRSSGPAVLEVTGPAFEAAFANGTAENRTVRRLKTLSSRGRTSLSLVMPPEAAAQVASGGSLGGAEGASSTPVRLNVAADSAVIDPIGQHMTLEGKVAGYYTLREVPAPGPSGTRAEAKESTYNFSGTKAFIKLVSAALPAGAPANSKRRLNLEMDVIGQPLSIELPNFEL